MKADLLNTFVYAGMRVLSGEAGIRKWQVEKPSLIPLDVTRHAVNVVVGVTGSVRGIVVYGMDLAVAKAVIAAMAGAPMSLTDDMAMSALGELGNLITGLASGALDDSGFPCRISPPAIIKGTAVRITPATVPFVVVPINTVHGRMGIYLALIEKE